MAFETRASLRTWLTGQLPTGAGGSGAATIINTAIADAVGYAGAWIRDTQRADFVGDGTTARFNLTGVDCQLLPEPSQETPTGVLTAATLSAPTGAPTAVVAATGGSITPGIYYAAIAYTTTLSGTTVYTPITAYVTTTVASGNTNKITYSFTAPSQTVDPNTGTQLYMSSGSGSADIRLHSSGAVTGATATIAVTALATAANARPMANYQDLFQTYHPKRQLEQDIGVDGTASIGTATLTLTTVPALGERFRVVYDCKPALPTADGDTIRVEQGQMRTIALYFAAKACSYVQESGDTTLLGDLAARTDLIVQDLMSKALPKLAPRARMPDPRS